MHVLRVLSHPARAERATLTQTVLMAHFAGLREIGVKFPMRAASVDPKNTQHTPLTIGRFFLKSMYVFEVAVFILKSMFWRAALDPFKIRAGARKARICARFCAALQNIDFRMNTET